MRKIAPIQDRGKTSPAKPIEPRRPLFPPPKMEPNLKSATLYPAEKQVGFRSYEGKKSKGAIPKDS
jgi:hypothetical protein